MLPQVKYASLNPSAPVPTSLGEDLLALTRAARVAQDDLYTAIRSCCSFGSTTYLAAFAPGSLPTLLANSTINTDVVLEVAESALLVGAGTSPVVGQMTGTIINSGVVTDCKVCASGVVVSGALCLKCD